VKSDPPALKLLGVKKLEPSDSPDKHIGMKRQT